MNMQDLMDKVHASTLQIVALALDASVEHPALAVTEELYEELLTEASKRMRSTIGIYLPAYPEAFDRVVVKHIGEQK